MMRKLALAGMIMGMVCLAWLPANADELLDYLSLDETLWELQNDVIAGVDHIGFYEDNIYACNSDVITLCLPLPYSDYNDFLIISFFDWDLSGDAVEIGFNGIAFPLLGMGFLITDDGDFSMLLKSDNDWSPFPF